MPAVVGSWASHRVCAIIASPMPDQDLDPRIRALCEKVTAKRPRTVIDHILKHGQVTTEELQDFYGYTHAPRAVRDVRESGVPIETFRTTSTRTGRKIAAYRFGSPSEIKRGRIGGRRAFSKDFKNQLLEHYGSRDTITGERMNGRYLQIDHRVPYEVAGDVQPQGGDRLEDYMLLDASNQRAKSWSCESCSNWNDERLENVCRTCFWAFPESYTHIAGRPIRRVIVEWSGPEVEDFERLCARAQRKGITVNDLIKRLLES